MSQPAPRTGQCPNCGASIDFKIGASRATVCSYCQAVVARKGQDFEAIGKVADLIPTGSRIALNSKGRLDKVAFEVVGRLQYEWKSGVWDEWYVAFSDGRWGWLAEAQGRFYLTFKVPPRPLPQRVPEPGESLFLEGLGRFTVSDVKQAQIVGMAGELPDAVTVGESPLTADLESEKGGFATLDLGTDGSHPALYVGRQVAFDALNLGGVEGMGRLKQARPTGDKLKCPNCGAPITVRIPDQTVRVVCESCHNLLDTTQGALQVIEAVSRGKHTPRIPLGAAGNLRGHAVLVAGFMTRSCIVDGIRYPWDEYLLWEEKTQSFLWLVESDGHWQLATPISVAEVHVADDALWNHRRFRHFSSVEGAVEQVLGEFYWEVTQGDTARLDDYVGPPEGLSCERSSGEVNWTHLDHLERAEVAEAFSKPGLATAQQEGVGAIQPWPLEATWTSLSHWMLGALGVLCVMLFVFALRPQTVYLDQQFSSLAMQAGATETTPTGEHMKGFLSKPFELSGHEAVRVEFESDVSQSWAFAGGALINDASGESVPFGVESSYYSGYDDGESWSEGSRSNSDVVSSPGEGKTVARADLQWDPKLLGPPNMHLRVVGDSFSGWQFFMVALLLLWPLLLLMHRASFEKARWYNSNIAPSGDDED
jgi:hypothetical protein